MFLSSILASLNLPAAIEVTEGNTLPPSILEKASSVRSSGGVAVLEQMLKDLPELFKRNKDILDEVGYACLNYLLIPSLFMYFFEG